MASHGEGANSSAGPSIYHIADSTSSGFKDKIFSKRIENLKDDLKTCMKECAVSRGMPATAALEYFSKRDMTGRPLIEAAEIFQKIAGAYRLRAKLEKNSRRRMFFLIYSAALAVTVRERLRQVHGPPTARESNKMKDREGEKVDAYERNNPTPSSDSDPPDGVLLAEKVDSFSYKVENRMETARRISEAEELICKIENDIQNYAGIKHPESLGKFSDKMYEKVKKMRKERYNYKENGESTLDVKKTREIMEKTAADYVSIMKAISDFCVDLLGQIPCEFAHIGMGSLAREDATPYSDFENLILLDEGKHSKNVYQYFRWYAVIFQCIVVRFGESPLRSFAISEFNDFNLGREKNWLWDDVINPGIRFDSIHPIAAKVPLGSLETEKEKFDIILKEELKEEYFQVLSYAAGLFLDDSLEQELIKPVSQMASFFLDDVNVKSVETSQQLFDALGKLESMILEEEISKLHGLSLEKIENVRKIALEDGFCFDEAGINSILEGILEIANSLRHKQLERKAGWHVREVLVFSRFIAGKKRIHDEFQRLKVDKISLLPKSYNVKKLKDTFKTLRTYFPKIDLAKSGNDSAEQTQDEFSLEEKLDPDFKHGSKDIFHRIICCFLMAVGREYGVYDGSLFDFLEKLHSRGIFSKEAKESLEFLVTSIYAWRDATYASLGGQEDYVFGVNESLVTNVLLLRHDTFRPDFQKMCSILVECRDILRRYFTRQEDSISLKDVIAQSNLMSTDHESVRDACGMFGFNRADITVCDNTASAFGLFGAIYIAVVAKRTAPYFIKKGNEMAETAASKLPLTGAAHLPRVVILPSDSKGGQKMITLQISSPQGPINIQIPQDLASRNDLTALHIPGAMISSRRNNASDVTATQPGAIQITPQMLAGKKVALFQLPQPGTSQTQVEVSTCSAEELPSKFNVPPETLKKLMEGGKRWPDGYSKNAMFSAMFGQEEMAKLSKNESERNRNFVDALLNCEMKEKLSEEMNKYFSHPEEAPDRRSKHADSNSEDQGGCQEDQHPQSSSISNPDSAEKLQQERMTKKKMLKIALEKAITDGTLQDMMTNDISDMIRSMVGQESMDTAGPKNPLISFGSKLVLPAVSFPSLIDKEKRLLLLSECRADQIAFEEFLTESENVNRFIIHDAEHSENAMDILFDYARLAIEHDGSHEMANQCRTKFAEIMAKFSDKCFYDEYVFNMMLQGFNHIIAKSDFALEKALNAIKLTSGTQ